MEKTKINTRKLSTLLQATKKRLDSEEFMRDFESKFREDQFKKLQEENISKILTQKKYFTLLYFLNCAIIKSSELPENAIESLFNAENSPNATVEDVFKDRAHDLVTVDNICNILGAVQLKCIDIFTFSILPSYVNYFWTNFGNRGFCNYFLSIENQKIRFLYYRAAFFSPLFVLYIYSTFCPFLSPVLSSGKFEGDITEFRASILNLCKSRADIFPLYIKDVLLGEAMHSGDMSGCLRESLIDYALLPSGCRASFLQVLGFVEPYQIPNPTFYRFLNTLFNNDFIGELCQCFCDIEDSYIDFISGADRDEVPSLFQPTVLSNYDKMALLNYRSPFNYKGEISFQTVYWEKKLPPLRDSLRRSSSTQNLVQEIKGFLSQIDFVPLSTNNVDLLRYLKLLADKGPIESKKARVASAQRIYNSIHSRSELWVEDVFDKMAEDDKTELIKLSAFSPMKAQLDKLDIQVDSVVERLYFTTYITLYTKTINKYYDNRQQITLEQAIESPKALKSEYESLTKYVYENNKFVPRQSEVNKTDVNKKLIPDKPVRIDGIKYYEIACHIYITRDFTYDRFKSLLPEFTRLDEKIFETISSKTSDYYIEQQLGSMKAKHRDFLKSYLNDDNAYFYIDDAFQRCDAYGFGDRLVYAINNMFIDCKNAFPNEVFGGDQKEPIVGAFFLCYCPRELLTTFAFYKYFYYDFFYKSKDSTVTQVYGQQKMLLQNILSEEEWNSLPESLKD